MKKLLALALVLVMTVALLAGCGGNAASSAPPANSASPTATADAGLPAVSPSAAPATDTPSVPTLNADAAKRAEEAYTFIAKLKTDASAFDRTKAKYHYTLNCHDPAASAAAEFLNAWSDAVLVATGGNVYIEVGVSNAFCTGGTTATLDDMISGALDFDWTLPSFFKDYMPLSFAVQNASLGIANSTVGAMSMWELYKNNTDVQAEYAAIGETFFVWANNPSPISYKGNKELTSISEIKGNVRANAGPAQVFVKEVGASIYGCPIGDVYQNVSTGVINYLITDWHGIASFKLFDNGVLNYYIDTNAGSSAYCLMANKNVWAEITKNGYADAIKSVSGDYCLNWIGIWEAYEIAGREGAASNGGTVYKPSGAFAAELETAYKNAATNWIASPGGKATPAAAQKAYDQVQEYVTKYNGLYGK